MCRAICWSFSRVCAALCWCACSVIMDIITSPSVGASSVRKFSKQCVFRRGAVQVCVRFCPMSTAIPLRFGPIGQNFAASVTEACARRPGAAVSVSCRRLERRILLAGGGRRASRSNTLATRQAFERMRTLSALGPKLRYIAVPFLPLAFVCVRVCCFRLTSQCV
jgi:hypothetical protein